MVLLTENLLMQEFVLNVFLKSSYINDKIDYENKTILIDGNTYHLEDTNFPTIDKENPYKLTVEEEKIINDLTKSFLNSEALQRHMAIFINKGSMYKIENNNLMYHALVPLNEDGSLKEVTINNESLSGKQQSCRIRQGAGQTRQPH